MHLHMKLGKTYPSFISQNAILCKDFHKLIST